MGRRQNRLRPRLIAARVLGFLPGAVADRIRLVRPRRGLQHPPQNLVFSLLIGVSHGQNSYHSWPKRPRHRASNPVASRPGDASGSLVSNRTSHRNRDRPADQNVALAPSPTHDDLHHFQKIQTARYLAGRGYDVFESMKEAEYVLGAIITAWNELMVPRSGEIDRMTAAQKTELFSSVQVDYSKSSPYTPRPMQGDTDPSVSDLERLDRQFHFLPPSHGRMVLDLGYPALIGAGMGSKRLNAIIKGAPVESKEEQISFIWAHELLLRLIIVHMMKGKEEGRAALREARQIALECIPAGHVTLILKEIRKNIAGIPIRQTKK